MPERRSLIGRVAFHALCLLIAVAAFAAHEHFRLQGQSTASLVSLVVAGLFALAPVRALLGELFAVERTVLHVVHGIGGLAVVGLGLGGYLSGAPVLNHAALAPFAIMGAAQAVMHQDHPRNARQAEALRRFAMSLPEVEQFKRATTRFGVTLGLDSVEQVIDKLAGNPAVAEQLPALRKRLGRAREALKA